MLLRSTVSSTKKFFQKTLKNFKSLFSPDYYERLPKTPQNNNNHYSYSVAANMVMDMDNNNNSTSYQELEKYHCNNDQWDSEKEKEAKRRNKNKAVAMLSSSPTIEQNEVYNNGSFLNFSNAQNKKKNEVEIKREEFDNKNNKRSLTHQRVNYSMRERGNCMVEQKLRELEMLDMSNVDHVLDIEEILHYYSRLTCPAYLEIVDSFFMQMYSEFFGPARDAAAPCSLNSMLMKLRYQ
ncbi:hypothetical protein RIF29_06631 [Crotalaria pallida]|uniref:Uncharacterized protein n=1 Tax=Crotalaria pallida TaxID=3830 RepID=A0AAN9J4I3_CROPI